MSAVDLTAEAVAYAENGWSVFPLTRRKSPRFKNPHAKDDPQRRTCRGACGRVGHGLYDAASDPDVIRAWSPWRMIAGRIPERLFALDVDPRGGGEETLARLEAEHGPLPQTRTLYSGRGDGGRHLFFARPPGSLTAARLGGIDLLHHRLRYSVLPPSPHPVTGQSYWWANPTCPVAQPPTWLVAALQPTPRVTSPFASPGAVGNGTGLVRFVANHSREEGSGRYDAVLWALMKAYSENADAGVIEDIKRAAVEIGKPKAEVDDMAAWAKANCGGAQ